MTKLAKILSLSATLAAAGTPWIKPEVARLIHSEPEGMNVLFIAVDDLRPELGSYGGLAKTPNLDRLAAEGVRFDRQFVQVPTCGASRFALLTGRYPRTTDHLSNEAFVRLLPREERPTPESFAELFRQNGYRTVSIGKISHYPDGRVFTYAGGGKGELEMPLSWSEVLPWSEIEGSDRKWGSGWNAFFGYADGSNRNANRGRTPAFEHADVPDDGYPDGRIADAAIRKLGELKGQRFMLAVGFFKPHLPFNAPEKYWDLYDQAAIPLSPNPGVPEGINPGSLHDSNEMFGSYAHPEKGGAGVIISDEYARTLRHGYLAAVSYSDAQVGRVLDELDRLGLSDNTIVVVWGDHGWHLGDQTIWGKHSTFERALRSPLLVRVPGVGRPGSTAEGIVEAVDIYPTLAELAGLPAPEGLDGRSFVPLLRNPAGPGKEAAYSRWTGRRTLRTDRYRVVLHEKGEPRVELFDHAADPLETHNVAAQHPEVVKRLLAKLKSYP
jgi:arylsulfatase A-like enzyme